MGVQHKAGGKSKVRMLEAMELEIENRRVYIGDTQPDGAEDGDIWVDTS